MPKIIISNDEARAKIASGIDKAADVVKITMGPRGRAVLVNRGVGPQFSRDGVYVAKQIDLEDEAEQDGAELVKIAARDTEKAAGDGTTLASVLVQSIVKQGLKALGLGLDPIAMRKGIQEALEMARMEIKKLSRPVKGRKGISDVATISSRDREVGDCVAAIVDKMGKKVVITVEESKSYGLHYEIVQGMKIDKGFVSPYFVTDTQKVTAVLEKPYVLTTSQVIAMNEDVLKMLNEVFASGNRSLLVIADTVKGEALATLILNKIQGRMAIAVVQAPGFGDNKAEQLKDIAALTGGKFVSEETGMKSEDVGLEDLGRADRVIVYRESTIIVGGKGRTKVRKEQIQGEIAAEKSEYKREMAEQRLARLSEGVAVIYVGTISEEENAEKRQLVEDAVLSAKASIDEGVVVGGGMALYSAAAKIGARADKEKDMAFRMGLKIIEEAIKEPARQIITNTGVNADVILAKAVETGKGYDSEAGEFKDLVASGIIDPAKVIRTALENAVSIASMFLITGAVIVEAPEKDKKEPD